MNYIKTKDLQNYTVVTVVFLGISVQVTGELVKTPNLMTAFLVYSKCAENFVYFSAEQIDFITEKEGKITIFLKVK